MRFRNMLVIIILICLIGPTFFIPFQKAFVFTETRTEDVVFFYMPIREDIKFQVIYTHSIHKSNVLESYRITNANKIQLISMEYEDLAIGMPGYAEEGQTFEEKDGIYKLSYDDKVINSFTLLVANIDMDLIFRYENKNYDLKKLLERSKSYKFEVKNISLYEQWKGVKMND
ncbi:DUF1850 domain-containing protein [Psychrobacillus sp. FSL K6-2836]|uniref:DUF1850 domain-containing protein n=1 Tax=Psychrobacillus sp. FSL K6-2836 TaxID=2921548 RepID=UPI0030FC6D99